MKKTVLVLFLSLVCSSIVLSQDTPLKREVRGAWIATVTNIDWPSSGSASVATQQQQLLTILDQLQAAGINVAIFQIRPECDALYQSPYEPWSIWLTGTQGNAPNPIWDPLEFAVTEAHQRGMELHAWFNPYRAERSAGSYSTSVNHVTKTHPEWILQVSTVKFLNPGLQTVRDHVAKVISDVVRRYDIDAAHMDDYFYVQGITTQDAATYASYPRGFGNVADWRRDNVNLLIKQIYDSIQVIKPWVKWGISPSGIWKSGTPPGITGMSHYNELYCDPVAWMAGNYIDYLAPQLYWKIGGSQDFTLLLPWWQSVSNGTPIFPGLAAYRIGDANITTAGEITNEIRFERGTTLRVGNFLYTTHNLTENRGGITDSLKTNLYKYKALIPPSPGKDIIAPNPPQQVRFARFGLAPIDVLQWDKPAPASDNDTAATYAVYKIPFTTASQTDIDDAKNILSVSSLKYVNPQTLPVLLTGNFTVTALDRNHNESSWSSVVSITAPPVQPLLASPLDNAADQPSLVNLRWNYATGSSIYKLQFASDTNFSTNLIAQPVLTDSTWLAGNLTGQQHYYWRVRGSNLAGDGLYSTTWSFFTGTPATPLLASPSNPTVDVEYTNLKLSWNKAGAAQSYRLQVSADVSFNPCLVDTAGLTDTSFVVPALQAYKIYSWRVRASNAIGDGVWSSVFVFRTKVATSVFDIAQIPAQFALFQNYPNPFNPETNIRFTITESNFTTLKIYNILGSEIATLVNGQRAAGTHTVMFQAKNLPSGVYIYRLTSGSHFETKKMVLVK